VLSCSSCSSDAGPHIRANQIVSGHPERHSFPNDGYERERGARGISPNDVVNLRSLCSTTALRDRAVLALANIDNERPLYNEPRSA